MKNPVIEKFHLDGKEVVKRQQVDVIQGDGKHGTVKKNNEGFLVGTAPVAKVGVMDYLLSDGTTLRQLLPPDTLFAQESIDTLKLKPVTDTHPVERRVTPDNASFRQVGSTGENVQKDGNFLTTSMVITDADLIASIEDGSQQELSPGYTVSLVIQDGVFEGQPFDAIQVGRQYNHVAVVDAARGGPEIKISLDSANIDIKSSYGYEVKQIDNKPIIKKEPRMDPKELPRVAVDGIDYPAAPEVVNRITKLVNDNATLVAAAEKIKKEHTDALAKLQGEHDVLKEKVEKNDKRDIQKEVQDAIAVRLELERLATSVIENVDAEEIKKLDDRALKIKLIDAKFPALAKKIDDKKEMPYIDAILDTVREGVEVENVDGAGSQRQIVVPVTDANPRGGDNTDGKGKEINANDARERMIKRRLDAHKPEVKK